MIISSWQTIEIIYLKKIYEYYDVFYVFIKILL